MKAFLARRTRVRPPTLQIPPPRVNGSESDSHDQLNTRPVSVVTRDQLS